MKIRIISSCFPLAFFDIRTLRTINICESTPHKGNWVSDSKKYTFKGFQTLYFRRNLLTPKHLHFCLELDQKTLQCL